MNDDTTPGAVRAPRKRPGRARKRISALLPAEPGHPETRDGSTQLASAPLRRGRRYPSIEYAMLKRVLAELQNAGSYIDQLALHMEQGNLLELPELLSARETNRKAIATILERLNGE